jgi:hypothetical protein
MEIKQINEECVVSRITDFMLLSLLVPASSGPSLLDVVRRKLSMNYYCAANNMPPSPPTVRIANSRDVGTEAW